MTDYTRLTVVGSVRRAELVVPDDESVGSLIPWLAEVLEEPVGSAARPLALVREGGDQLEGDLTVAEHDLGHGERVRLVAVDEAPAPPEVADVTDVLADTHDTRTGRWSQLSRQAVAAVGTGAFTLPAALLLSRPDGPFGPRGLALAAAVLLVAAVVGGRTGRWWAPVVLTAAAAAIVPVVVLRTGLATDGLLTVLPAAAALVWVCLGTGLGLGLGRRPVLAAAALGAVLLGLLVLLPFLGLPRGHTAAVVGAAALLACGLLPWWALSVSGLTGLDDEVLAGRPGRRDRVLRTTRAGYAALSFSVWAVAVPLALCGAVLLASVSAWELGLGIVVVCVTWLRTRTFPLAVQQIPLWAAGGAAVLAGLVDQPRLDPGRTALLLVVLAVAAAFAGGLRPAEHVRARLRRTGNLVEALAVIALVPLLLGAFGVYADLVRAFPR